MIELCYILGVLLQMQLCDKVHILKELCDKVHILKELCDEVHILKELCDEVSYSMSCLMYPSPGS